MTASYLIIWIHWRIVQLGDCSTCCYEIQNCCCQIPMINWGRGILHADHMPACRLQVQGGCQEEGWARAAAWLWLPGLRGILPRCAILGERRLWPAPVRPCQRCTLLNAIRSWHIPTARWSTLGHLLVSRLRDPQDKNNPIGVSLSHCICTLSV